MSPKLQRQTFRTSRALEFFSLKELALQTGHASDRWPEVILKELLDNSLDACEDTDTLPEITATITPDGLVVEDSGPGLPAGVVESILDFAVRVSSKDAYVLTDARGTRKRPEDRPGHSFCPGGRGPSQHRHP